jgi:hypothetical protein
VFGVGLLGLGSRGKKLSIWIEFEFGRQHLETKISVHSYKDLVCTSQSTQCASIRNIDWLKVLK